MLQDDGRTRLSQLWIPTGGITPAAGTLGLYLGHVYVGQGLLMIDVEDTPSRLIRGGFVRQVSQY